MTKVKMSASKEDFEQAGKSGDFELPPVGLYHAELVEAVPGYKKVDGKEDKSRPNLKCAWKLTGAGREGSGDLAGNYGYVYDYITFGESSGWHRAEFMLACGIGDGKKAATKEIEVEPGKPGSVVGTVVLMRVKHEKQEGYDTSAKVGKLLPLLDDSNDGDAFADTDSADDSDPFGGTTDDVPGDDDLLTEEQLAEMEPAELKEVAEQFDVDVHGFEPKGRTKEAKRQSIISQVIEAILEAQGGDEDGSDGDDSDPF